MTPFVARIVSAVLTVTLSVAFGFLPALLAWRCAHVLPTEEAAAGGGRRVWLAFLLNLGGGVLLANCFCHWLPEVREAISHENIDTPLPLAEVVMCAGFFLICLLEEAIHHCVHRPKKKSATVAPAATNAGPGMNSDDECLPKEVKRTNVEAGKPSEEEDEDQVMAAVRTFFVVSALSFHSVVEGLALTLEKDTTGIWMSFGAVAMHKFVIAFSVGVELVTAQVTRLQYSVSILVFALAPALGVIIGMVLTDEQEISGVGDFTLQILQGIATGTIVYVVFFEIFPRAKHIGGTGFAHVIAMILGFLAFLPSLFFHVHSHEESANSGNETLHGHEAHGHQH